MNVFKTKDTLQKTLELLRSQDASLGLVPTMGALHEGHLSLVRSCRQNNDFSVVSIYVNPTQFNDNNDLKNYPRDPERDLTMLESVDCQYVFMPDDHEMYPEPDTRVFDFGQMGSVMEGKHRPGHFNGVGQIVTKLFDIVKPDRAYFGQKDFQQLAIIRKLVADFNYPIEIIGCPIVREPDGLAMSSRNQLLTPEHRKAAPLIYQTLRAAKEMAASAEISAIKKYVDSIINSHPLLKLEYFQIVESATLKSVKSLSSRINASACIAVFAGRIRLIDNIDLFS
jgi:pantoate--beta-alanine ligase